jgi:hypothetical protein
VLLLLREIIVVNSQNYTAHINTMCEKHAKIFHTKEGSAYVFNHCGLKFFTCLCFIILLNSWFIRVFFIFTINSWNELQKQPHFKIPKWTWIWDPTRRSCIHHITSRLEVRDSCRLLIVAENNSWIYLESLFFCFMMPVGVIAICMRLFIPI